jgi:hypothetical protein
MRWSKKVAEGLSHIADMAEVELSAHQISFMECRCDACTGKIEDEDNEGAYLADAPCQCDEKPFAKKCEGCRTTEEWGEALLWLHTMLRKRAK